MQAVALAERPQGANAAEMSLSLSRSLALSLSRSLALALSVVGDPGR